MHFITTTLMFVLKKRRYRNQVEMTENSVSFLTNLSLTFGTFGGTGSRSAPLSSGLSVFVFSSSEDGRMCILSLCLWGALMATKSLEVKKKTPIYILELKSAYMFLVHLIFLKCFLLDLSSVKIPKSSVNIYLFWIKFKHIS